MTESVNQLNNDEGVCREAPGFARSANNFMGPILKKSLTKSNCFQICRGYGLLPKCKVKKKSICVSFYQLIRAFNYKDVI